MKWIFLSLLISFKLHAACSSISRTNASSSSILTSSKYNTDINTVYNFVNNYDGGCIAAGSLEAAALNTTEFAPLTNQTQGGCSLNYVDSNTVSVNACQIGVNGKLLTTATATQITWGCSGCSSEATGSYYVYVKDNSTFTLAISNTAPNSVGYSGSDKVVGGFYNNSALNIATSSIYQWNTNSFTGNDKKIPISGNNIGIYTATIAALGGVSNDTDNFLDGDCTNSNPMVCNFQTGFWASTPSCFVKIDNSAQGFCYGADSQNSTRIGCTDDGGTISVLTYQKKMFCIGVRNGI